MEAYFYDRRYKKWFSVDAYPSEYNTVLLDIHAYDLDKETRDLLQNARKNNKFIIIRNGIYGGVPSKTLYIKLDDAVRFISKSILYWTRDKSSRTCFNIELVKNPKVLKNIKTQYPYIVDFIDVMQRDEHPLNNESEMNLNYTRAKRCFEDLTEDQKMYYLIEGDQKYLKL